MKHYHNTAYTAALLLALAPSALKAFTRDSTVFWKAPSFDAAVPHVLNDASTQIAIRYTTGRAQSGYNAREKTTSILNIYGSINVPALALNLENIATNAAKPKTFETLRASGGSITGFNFTGEDGTLALGGRIKARELALDVRHTLKHGFFGELFVPLRSIKLNAITITDKTNPTNPNATAFSNFVSDDLDTVLSENGYDALTTPFNDDSIGDITLLAGWHGRSRQLRGTLQDIAGELAFAATMPSANDEKRSRVVNVPLGYNGHFGLGVNARVSAHVMRWLALGLQGRSHTFFTRTTTRRMQTDTSQRGLIILEQGRTNVDLGTLWNFTLYAQADRFFEGLSIIAGYTFAAQEATKLDVRDGLFLKTLKESNSSVNKNNIVNGDERLKEWSLHTLHIAVQYLSKPLFKWSTSPTIELFYNYPFWGKRAFKTDTVGGSGGIAFTWKL